MNTVFLGLGTNIGDREANLRKAVAGFNALNIEILKISKVYETPAWGFTAQPDFLNICVQCQSELPPLDLLRSIKALEQDLGRQESFRWGPRLIDIDILYFNHEVHNFGELKIPHPGIAERDFVLKPLFDIAPDFINPANQLSTKAMLNNFKNSAAKVLEINI